MASAISHGIAALGIGTCFYKPRTPKSVWLAGVVCSMFPDIDVIGFRFGIHYGDFWGHRGMTHSLVFAALLAGVTTLGFIASKMSGIGRVSLFAYLFLATASHGLLDAMTNGGLGVAFLSPFDDHRYFLPWRPIRVSPIGVARFFTTRGWMILQSELLWIWLPTVALAVLAITLRRATLLRHSRQTSGNSV